MSGYFEENKKFFSLRGVLNRRNFFVNLLIIELIESLLVTPVVYLMFLNLKLCKLFLLLLAQFGCL